MSNIIYKDDGTPFLTVETAKAKRTRMGKDGLDYNVVEVAGGYVLEGKPYDKPSDRIPVGSRDVLSVRKDDKDPNYIYRFVNDDPGRIRMFRDAGWEIVERRESIKIGDPDVGSEHQLGSVTQKTVGRAKVAYLMRQRKKFYTDDQEAKAEKIRQGESEIVAQTNQEGRYGKVGIKQLDRP